MRRNFNFWCFISCESPRTPDRVRSRIDISDDDCREDIWAKALLAGEAVECIDRDADGQTYGPFGAVCDSDGHAHYSIRIDDVRRGLGAAWNGTFKAKDEEEMAHDNLPEPIQWSEKGEAMQECVNSLDSALASLDEAIEYLHEAL